MVRCMPLLMLSYIYINEAARILAVYPTPSISHQVVFRRLTNELLKRGHEVVVITTDPEHPKSREPANLTEIDVHDIAYDLWKRRVDSYKVGDVTNVFDTNDAFFEVMIEIFEKQLMTDEVRDIIENQRGTFDLLIVETWVKLALGLSHVIKAPVIQFASLGPMYDNLDAIGAAYHPVFFPQCFHQKVHDFDLWERVQQYWTEYWFRHQINRVELLENNLLKRIFGPDMPPLRELRNNVDMSFFNIHRIWEGNRPAPTGLIFTPGLHQNEQKEISEELKKYLDDSVHGVIYISFGTNVNTSSLPPERVRKIITALSRLPYDVLWKWSADFLPGKTKNIKISKWFPQSDLLRHPKIKVFITQGGLQSTDEAITAGVPMIGVPMLADQYFNTEKYVQHKIGLKVMMKDIEVESFRSDIKKVIIDDRYRKNVVRLRAIMDDQPMSSLERAVWWTEHVIQRGGARHVRSPAANMPWTEYYDLGLIFALVSCSMTVIAVFSLVLYYTLRVLLRKMAHVLKGKFRI